MRKVKFAPGEYYHVYNRGNDKKDIFLDDIDYARFLFLILHFQAPVPLVNLSRQAHYFVKHSVFNIKNDVIVRILENRGCELVSFALMPNHFHLLLKENSGGGISAYMQRSLNGFTKYFNTKYEKSGHLFQGPFQAVHVENNDQLLYLSAYIHRNPISLPTYHSDEHLYPWSSYKDYVIKNRWGNLLTTQPILEQFPTTNDYHEFVQTSNAKNKVKDMEMLNTRCLTN